MAELFQRIMSVRNERVNEKGSDAEAAGFEARLARMRYEATQRGETPPTIDDIGTEKFSLRENGEADDRDEMISALRGEAAKMTKFAIAKAPVAENGEVVVTQEPVASGGEKRELTPEDAATTLRMLEARFTAPENLKLHEGVSWDRVKVALEANPEALWSINKMQAAGHEPDVYDFDDEGFDIGTCSKESPVSGRNCVYDARAAKWLKDNRPQEKISGSAVEMAEAMGIALMHPDKYEKVLQAKGEFDLKTWSYLLTDETTRDTGGALDGFRDDSGVHVEPYFADSHSDRKAWRGSLRVKWAA